MKVNAQSVSFWSVYVGFSVHPYRQLYNNNFPKPPWTSWAAVVAPAPISCFFGDSFSSVSGHLQEPFFRRSSSLALAALIQWFVNIHRVAFPSIRQFLDLAHSFCHFLLRVSCVPLSAVWGGAIWRHPVRVPLQCLSVLRFSCCLTVRLVVCGCSVVTSEQLWRSKGPRSDPPPVNASAGRCRSFCFQHIEWILYLPTNQSCTGISRRWNSCAILLCFCKLLLASFSYLSL